MGKLNATKTGAIEAGTKQHSIDRVMAGPSALSVGVRPVERPGRRWKVTLSPTNYKLRRGDVLTWNQLYAFWTPKGSSVGRTPKGLFMIHLPEPLD